MHKLYANTILLYIKNLKVRRFGNLAESEGGSGFIESFPHRYQRTTMSKNESPSHNNTPQHQ